MLAVRVQDYYGFRECSCFCPQISKTHAKGASCTTGCEPGIGIAKADAFYYCVIIKEYWGKNKKSQGIFVVKSLCTLHRLNTNLRKKKSGQLWHWSDRQNGKMCVPKSQLTGISLANKNFLCTFSFRK